MANTFEDLLREAHSFFLSFEHKNIRIISHLDCDGVAACAILANLCKQTNHKYSLQRVQNLDDKTLAKIKQAKEEVIIFADIGSSQIEKIKEQFQEKAVLIIDHHVLIESEKPDHIFELNPKLVGENERRTISSSGIAYMFSNQFFDAADLAPIALLGAIGDAQEENGFIGYNKEILDQAIQHNLIQTKQVLRLFGRQTRPIHKAIEYSVDIPMKGITNDKSACKNLLYRLRIPLKREDKWVTLATLTEREEDLLTEALLEKMDQKTKEKAFWTSYTLTQNPEGSPTRDLREFSTLLNACGRLNDLQLGVDICLNKKDAAKKAQDQLKAYKDKIRNAKLWVEQHKDQVQKEKGLIIINAKGNISPDIAGTVTSIFTRSGFYEDGTVVCTLARTENNQTKISTRINNKKINLVQLLKEIIKETGGECGGHANAAGALIDQDKENQFIELLKQKIK